jgi:hypothetical protein
MHTHVCQILLPLIATALLSSPVWPAQAEPPCDRYQQAQQARCLQLWKQLNREAAAEVAQFGLDQLKRRQAGTITQEQHLKENMEFIKRSTDKRLKLLSEQMAQAPSSRQPKQDRLQR